MTVTSGIMENLTYGVYIDGFKYKSIYFDTNSSKNTYYVYSGSSVIKIVIGQSIPSNMEFANTTTGEFLDIVTS